ncbi:MAG: ion transporter [Alphaproteobacteria bacterium]
MKLLAPGAARRRYACSPFMIIDLLAILPTLVAGAFGMDLRFLRIFRLLRLLKLARYSPTINTLGRVLWQERHALGEVVVDIDDHQVTLEEGISLVRLLCCRTLSAGPMCSPSRNAA